MKLKRFALAAAQNTMFRLMDKIIEEDMEAKFQKPSHFFLFQISQAMSMSKEESPALPIDPHDREPPILHRHKVGP